MTESHPDPRNPEQDPTQHNAEAPQPETPDAAQNTAPQGPEQSTTPTTPQAPVAAEAPSTPEAPTAPAQQYTPYPAPAAPTPPVTPASYAPPSGPRYGEYAPPQQHTAASEATPPATPPTAPTGAFGQPQPESAAVATATAPRRRAGVSIIAALAIGAVVGGVAGAGVFGIWSASQGSGTRVVASSGAQTITVNNAEDATTATAVAAKATPSVVTIAVSGSSSSGTGSGIILSKDGYVLTNTHVVTLDGEIADPTISVTTSDGKIYDATLVGTDPTDDLAVIKLTDASGLTPITWGDSSDVNVGDTAVAIGAPLGLASTVTDGIISALNRSIQVASSAAPDSSTEDDSSGSSTDSPFNFDIPGQTQQSTATTSVSLPVIQTDASINPGNSGGALLNSDGELIGINVAIASAGSSSSSSDQSGSIGVGFAIESNVAKRIADEIIANGSATHGLLGASVADSTTGNLGAAIQDVTSSGAAAGAGLKKGDIVTNVNGTPITSASDLTAQVRAQAAGSSVTITYVRDGETFELKDVTLGTMAG
ncbi:trypsin-like peptidase domain-containing protein [Microbacteriaceae bacterium VKM Ac-2854]|nr:trypsin-like peptidase domain-containing protein [Microbacteriaceae bacterium VKM Ac-2854]